MGLPAIIFHSRHTSSVMSRAEETPVPLRPHIHLTCALLRRHHLFGAYPWHTCLGTSSEYIYIIRGNINIIRGTLSEAHPPRQHHPRHIIRVFHLVHLCVSSVYSSHSSSHSSVCSSLHHLIHLCVHLFIISFICVGGATLADTISSENASVAANNSPTKAIVRIHFIRYHHSI